MRRQRWRVLSTQQLTGVTGQEPFVRANGSKRFPPTGIYTSILEFDVYIPYQYENLKHKVGHVFTHRFLKSICKYRINMEVGNITWDS